MTELLGYLQAHASLSVALAWIFSAIVAGMPEPETQSSAFYRWAYKTLHIISANAGMWKKQTSQGGQKQ